MGIILKLSLLSNRKIIQNVLNKICFGFDDCIISSSKSSNFSQQKGSQSLYDSGQSCVFPFRYQGIVYNKCADVSISGIDNNQAWCSTEVTSGGEHIDGKVAVCPNTCSGAESKTAASTTTTTTTTTTPTTTTTTTTTTTVATVNANSANNWPSFL